MIIKKIEQTEKRLSDAVANKESTLSKINALELQIDARNELIENLSQAANSAAITDNLTKIETVTPPITSDEDVALEDYMALLRIRYRNKLLNKDLKNLQQDADMNEYITKKRYLESYGQSLLSGPSVPVAQIESEHEIIDEPEVETVSDTDLLQREILQRDALKNEMAELMALATSMTSQERTLKNNLDQHYNQWENFNRAIERILVSSMSSGHTTSAVQKKTSAPSQFPSSVGTIKSKRGFLPWPVTDGKVTKRYGPQPHPSAPEITIENKGVDVSSADASVSAIFSGQVISVSKVGTSGQTVIVRHEGNYYSVYSGISEVHVLDKQSVTQGQSVGSLKSGNNGRHTLHFELYHEKQSLNPRHWLKNN